jgi:hypothetical protein
MPHATIHGANGHRHDVEGAEISVGIFFGGQTLEFAVEAPKTWHLRTSGASFC